MMMLALSHSSPAGSIRRRRAAMAHATFALAMLCAASAAEGKPMRSPTRLPARALTCTAGHATNFNPELQQTHDDITFDTHHRLSLYLPAIKARTTPIPDATEAAERVDPRTRITEDPDGITADAPGPFNRVVDLWPERVELAKTTPAGTFKTLLISDYDPARGTAQLFLGTAADLTTYDLKRIYMGECKVALSPRNRRSAG